MWLTALTHQHHQCKARRFGSAAQKLGCQRVVYVSCDPAALARDAENLKACGYSPKELQLIDMFPQTRHAEVVIAFARQSPRVS